MYNYSIALGNPEGLDWELELYHEQKFSENELQYMVEQVMVDVLNDMSNMKKYPYLDQNRVYDGMVKLGFTSIEFEACYHLEPICNSKSIKNLELLSWIERRHNHGQRI